MLREYGDLRITIEGGVATIGMLPSGDAQYKRMRETEGKVKKFFPKHKEVGEAIEELRGDNEVRVIVLTGLGDMFFIPPSAGPGIQAHDPGEDWDLSQGLARTFNAIIECEKPVIARVNGAAVAYGSSLVFACDFVVADEEALIADYHLGMGEIPFGRPDFGVVPGDGGAVFVPMQMTLAHARDFLLLARPFTGREVLKQLINPSARHDNNNIGPRVGFAWDVQGNGKLLARGAYGRFYQYLPQGGMRNELGTLLQNSISITNPSYPDPYNGLSPSAFVTVSARPNIKIGRAHV